MTQPRSAIINRRSFIRGLGVCVALPTLESLLPSARALGAAVAPATTATGMPLRAAFIAFANGSNYHRWLPKGEVREFELNQGFVALKNLQDNSQILPTLAD